MWCIISPVVVPVMSANVECLVLYYNQPLNLGVQMDFNCNNWLRIEICLIYKDQKIQCLGLIRDLLFF